MSNKGVVKFNVGGTRYEVARSLLEAHPDTMVTRMASEDWQQNAEAEIFIERDGTRFKYFLDYLRDGKISLPLSVSKDAMLADMNYYGVDPEDRVNYQNIVMSDMNSIFLDCMNGSEKTHQKLIDIENNLAKEIQTTKENLKTLEERMADATNKTEVFRGARVIYEKILSEVVLCKSSPGFPSTLSFSSNEDNKRYTALYNIHDFVQRREENFDLLQSFLIECFGVELICLREDDGYWSSMRIEFIVKHGRVN